MLDALIPCVEAMQAVTENDYKAVLTAGLAAAQEGANSTATMAAMAGRSSYLNQKAVEGTVDPGAQAAVVWISALAKNL
jgi:triose/dihydroxyacetone kinase / FAD-AMP lyase (cyclizing)